jgi:hypothetical protein
MKNFAMTGSSMSVVARLVAAVAMAGLLGTGSLATAKSAPLPDKLQGNYGPFSLVYFVDGKAQDLVVLRGFVEVGSAGLVAVDFTDVVSAAGVDARLVFNDGMKPAGTTSSSGTVTGTLLANQGTFLVKSGTYTATLDGSGLRLIVQMKGTFGLGGAAADKTATEVGKPGSAVMNILLRKTKVR